MKRTPSQRMYSATHRSVAVDLGTYDTLRELQGTIIDEAGQELPITRLLAVIITRTAKAERAKKENSNVSNPTP